MSGNIEDRVLALAGLAQALAQVRRIADTGQADAAVLETALGSVFRIDADTPAAVYGDASALRPGMRLLHGYFGGASSEGAAPDPLLPRLALSVMQLERRFIGDASMGEEVLRGIDALQPLAGREGVAHPEVLSGLGKLYAETVSHLRPRVMVQGNPHYLAQADVVAEIRAVLLAALRSAVLWRQLGGSFWDLLLRRREMAEVAEYGMG